ncbi:MAG: hypothetical protein ABIJ00_12465 [Candidatus Eisenbacteria bacterium]
MILEKGEKVHIMVRRLFENDLRRHFVGEVIEVSGDLARMEGYVYVLDSMASEYIRRRTKRIRLIGLVDPGNIINVLPPDTDLEKIKYTEGPEGGLVVTDGKALTLDINEFGATR